MIRLKPITICFILALAFGISSVFAQPSERDNYKGSAPKYIFYFIGDGMGLSQANTAEAYLAAINNTNGIQKLKLNTLPKQGFYTTYATDRFITGSAAAGTALSTGIKTSISTVGMDAKRQTPLKTIAELAKEKDYKVGIVSSVSIDHATPASFYAHQPSRSMYYNISLDLSKSGFNYFAGGGFKHPEGDGKIDQKNTMANFGMGGDVVLEKKESNSIKIAESRGYRFTNTVKEFKALKKGDDKIISIAPKMAGGNSLPYFIDQKGKSDISLADFTKKGIELLDNPKGFFMMVEGGKIDWACHANDAATVIQEVLQFDNAVAVALDFYKKHPEETLILVAGDHETGGMAMGFAGNHYESAFALLQHQNISYENFSEIIAKYKKKKEGKYKLDDGLALVKKHFGLGDAEKGLELSEFEMQQLQNAFEKSMNYNKAMKKSDQFYLLYGSYDPFTITACHILSQKAGIGWTSFSHTAAPIPIRSIGVGADLFTGFFDNTDVPKNLIKLIEKR
ncbi:alkaline phosphatase [Marinifilum caeruleilacunae]|uniref:Alkaline phosphatase n=1 Tax=Marinifilum caeruleilacunae TaxID=2499076 RepID=A0ABX1WSS8_9BACT|nr:alkaline phosphatase [Marinifilum caeruleilacunae]NOU59154.1 alkaline phosphatase [Marinifilum caeruleilacunae]